MSKNVKILVIEDSLVITGTLEAILRREGYEPLIVHDGLEARNFMDTGEIPAAVLLDILLPYVDGFALLAEMRQKVGWQKLPVIMISAKSQEKDVIRALDMGASDYMVKPFRPGELTARLRRHLNDAP